MNVVQLNKTRIQSHSRLSQVAFYHFFTCSAIFLLFSLVQKWIRTFFVQNRVNTSWANDPLWKLIPMVISVPLFSFVLRCNTSKTRSKNAIKNHETMQIKFPVPFSPRIYTFLLLHKTQDVSSLLCFFICLIFVLCGLEIGFAFRSRFLPLSILFPPRNKEFWEFWRLIFPFIFLPLFYTIRRKLLCNTFCRSVYC